MTIRNLPAIRAFERPSHLEMAPSADAMAKWDAGVRAADDGDATISIFDVIGQDDWTGTGFTAKRMDAALRSIGKRDVVVNINSPGGDLFEGIAIYNLLRSHSAKVTVRIMGIAASAASIIAMAGDDVQISRAGFLMIHNAWVIAMGNRNDLREVADWLEPFDAAMTDVYAARTSLANKAIAKLMDEETWIGGGDAVDKGFADGFVPADQVTEDTAARAAAKDQLAVRRVDALLAKQGIPRSERRSLIAGMKSGTPGAAAHATHDAGITAADIQRLIATLKS